MPRSARLVRLRGEGLQQLAPPHLPIDRSPHSFRALTVTTAVAMFEIDASGAVCFRREPHFHFARLCEVRLVSPTRADLPRDDKPLRRLPDQYLAPVAVGAVDLFAVTAPPDFPFDNGLL